MIATESQPLVTIMIATKDRPDDLRRTLHELRRQDYPSIELLVIDDGSRADLEPIVREEWPAANFVRESESRAQSQRRSEAFLLAKGEYILQLDDDSAPVEPDALRLAVQYMTERPKVGILSFLIYNGTTLPLDCGRPPAKFDYSFIGCGALLRTVVVRQVGGYRSFFKSEGEEPEYALRVLDAGWSIKFFPDVLVHHHVTPVQRPPGRSWVYGFRNKLWTGVMHLPLHRALVEGVWTVTLAAWDAVRLFQPRLFGRAMGQFIAGLPQALRLRQPISKETLRLYDALRFRGILTEEEYRSPPALSLSDAWLYYRRNWLNRPRRSSVWNRNGGDVGSSETVKFAHEFVKTGASSTPSPTPQQTGKTQK